MTAKLLFKDNTLIPIYSNENGLCTTLEELCFGRVSKDIITNFMGDLNVSDDNVTDFYLSIPFEEGLKELSTFYYRTKNTKTPLECNDSTINWNDITDQEVSFFKKLFKLTNNVLCFK